MTYAPTYDADDMSSISIDIFGTGMAAAVKFAAIIVIIGIGIWGWNAIRKK